MRFALQRILKPSGFMSLFMIFKLRWKFLYISYNDPSIFSRKMEVKKVIWLYAIIIIATVPSSRCNRSNRGCDKNEENDEENSCNISKILNHILDGYDKGLIQLINFCIFYVSRSTADNAYRLYY